MSVIPTQKFRFLGGEVSPNMYNSADMDQYGRWFSKAENIRFDTLGAFKNRTGFEKIAQSKVSNGTAIKLLSFSFSREENYLIEMGPNYFRFFQNGTPIYIGGDPDNGIYEVAHDMSITAGDIKYAQSGDILYLVNGVNPMATLTRNDITGYNWTYAHFVFKDGCLPLDEENTDPDKYLNIANTAGTITVSSVGHSFFADKQAGDVFGVSFDVPADSTTLNSASQSAVGSTSSVIKTNGRFAFSTTGTWQGTIVLEYSVDGSSWQVFRTLSSLNKQSPHNDNVAGVVSADSDLVYMRIRVTEALSHDTYPLNAYLFGEKFSVICYYRVISKTSDTVAVCEAVKNSFVIEQGQTISGLSAWRNPAFSQSAGYPSVVGFYQNRLILGKEYMLYASKTNQFDNFYEPATLIADDPVTMSLLSNKYNRVRNILTVRKFFAFTEEGEFGIASQGALTQTDKNLLPISYHGSNTCTPILAGNLALFVDFSGRVVRLFQYSYETDAFEASDASVLLEQLLKGHTIITTDYLKNTKEALFLDNQGTIWVFKLMPEQEIYAWSHWKYAPAGKITNMRVVPNGSEEELYICVEDYDLGEKRIERLSTSLYTDSVKTYTSENSIRRWFTDFDEDTVLVVDYGDARSKIIVGENGLVEIPEPQTAITCHYSYTSEATLLSPVQNLTEGAMTTYNKGKPFKVHFCYQDSFGFKVGVQEEEKMYVRFNSGDRPETQELTSGKRSVLLSAKYDGSSRVSFIQERPYNMCVNNIMIDMDYGGK